MTPPQTEMQAEGAALGAGLTLAEFVGLGWDRHADEPEALARALIERAASLPADPDGAAAIGLAEHLWLAHLRDAPGLAAWLDTLAPGLVEQSDGAAASNKARWALAQLLPGAVTTAGPTPNGRARAFQNVWSFRIALGEAVAVQTDLGAESAAALADSDSSRVRGLAATCNNLALELREGVRGDAARDALMLALAEASKALWTRVGTWVHAERAEYQLARCHAVLGQADAAMRHARAVLDALRANAAAPEADDFEWFYGWEALAWAGAAAGDASVVADARAQMAQRLQGVADPELRGWCALSLTEFDNRAS